MYCSYHQWSKWSNYDSYIVSCICCVNLYQETADELLGNLAPPWLPDNCVSMCMMCSMRFTMTRRRHHCRGCGKVSYCTLIMTLCLFDCRYFAVHVHLFWLLSSIKTTKWIVCVKIVMINY